LIVAVASWTAAEIYFYNPGPLPAHADGAIVLGAAVWGKEPSPVFKERINHAIDLYQEGRVGKIILTGGFGEGSRLADSVVARRYAIRMGIPGMISSLKLGPRRRRRIFFTPWKRFPRRTCKAFSS